MEVVALHNCSGFEKGKNMADLNKLVEKIKADTELKKQFAQAVKEDKVEEFCKGLGIETTKEEIAEFLNVRKNQELSEEELSDISGGCGKTTRLSVFSIGMGCAIMSINHEIIEKSTCIDY